MFIKLKKLHPKLGKEIPYPSRLTPGAIGLDLCAALDYVVRLYPGRWMLIPCGFAIAIPPGYEGQIRPRSGMASTFAITVLNSPGTIDSDYRGEIQVLLYNHGLSYYDLRPGARIAQLVIAPVAQYGIEVVDELPETERGEGGFGSTGE
jgi:dUTP pyrophosphatase